MVVVLPEDESSVAGMYRPWRRDSSIRGKESPASADPVVRPAAERVTRRLAVIEAAFAELGHPPELARHYATASYSAYVGTAALRRVGAAPDDPAAYVEALLATFGIPPAG